MRLTWQRLSILSVGGLALTVWGVATHGAAVETRTFRLDDAQGLASDGLEGTAVLSNGTVVSGTTFRSVPLPDAAVAWSAVRADNGSWFVGTGHEGKIFQVSGDQVRLHAETGELLVTDLVFAWGGTLVAATLPHGTLFQIDSRGRVTPLQGATGVESVWDLSWDAENERLFAATGPEGKVIVYDHARQPSVYWDSEAEHVLALAAAADGTLFAGTDRDALVVRLVRAGVAEVVYDFPGNEITDLDAARGELVVVANEFPAAPSAPNVSKNRARRPRPRPGKGQLWRMSTDGRLERLVTRDDRHFTRAQIQNDGAILVAGGTEGQLFRVEQDGATSTWADVDERQIRFIDGRGGALVLLTADGASFVQAVGGHAAQRYWTSKVLDAQFLARFGALRWRSRGALRFQTRSGNREQPDDTWSTWSSAIAEPGPIRSPAARFLQLRADFSTDPNAELYSATAHYLPQNQRARVRDVRAEVVAAAANKTKNGSGPPVRDRPSTRYKISWTVENPDGDPMRYELRFREESHLVWRAILKPGEELYETSYEWETEAIPDGWYIVEVVATDAPANPATLALSHRVESEGVLVDNHAPRITTLESRQGVLHGAVVDRVGPIRRLELAVNGGRFEQVHPLDGLLDSRSERFEVQLPAQRPLIAAIRATDQVGNQVTRELVLPARGN